MNKYEIKRKGIFTAYVENLNLLISNGYIDKKENIYICPICLDPHHKLNLENPLTLEDAPPKALGGKSNVLTCKRCNNTCGYKIDSHLIQCLKDLDKLKLLPNSKFDIEFEIDGVLIRGQMEIDEDGNQKFTSSLKNNNPTILHKIMQNAVGKSFSPSVIPGKSIDENLEYALLKTAYLLAFEKFGYCFILDKSFDIVRQQLLNPESRVYPKNFWITPKLPEHICGSYLVCNEKIKSIISIFNLDTSKSKKMFMVFLPIPNSDIHEIAANYESESDGGKEIIFELFPMHSVKNYLNDLDAINKFIEMSK